MLDNSPKLSLFHGDCLNHLRAIPDGSVDMVLTDPPYGTTDAKWDSVIPFCALWCELHRVTKPNGAILLFASQPFTTDLILSNRKNFRYIWYWKKNRHSNPFLASSQPLRVVEDVVVFYRKKPLYIPKTQPVQVEYSSKKSTLFNGGGKTHVQTRSGYPVNVLEFSKDSGFHPTQKPVALLEYLISLYTLRGEVVLDFTMGSGSTGVACVRSGRRFIGIERDLNYYSVASVRIKSSKMVE